MVLGVDFLKKKKQPNIIPTCVQIIVIPDMRKKIPEQSLNFY